MRNHPSVIQRMSAFAPGDLAVSTVTSYELFTGVAKCANPEKELAKVNKLLQIVNSLPFDFTAALEAARIRASLESRGQSIGPYDLLLAGHAVSVGIVLATNNTAEFSRIDNLTLDDWHRAASS